MEVFFLTGGVPAPEPRGVDWLREDCLPRAAITAANGFAVDAPCWLPRSIPLGLSSTCIWSVDEAAPARALSPPIATAGAAGK